MSYTIEQVPGFLFIDHIAVSVPPGELEAQVRLYKSLGFQELHREEVLGGDQVREVLLQMGSGPNRLQLLEPLSADSPVARQLERNGGRVGLAHIAFRVSNIQRAFESMKAQGFAVLDEAPRTGSCGATVFFVHPRREEAASLGYLLEIVQEGSHAG